MLAQWADGTLKGGGWSSESGSEERRRGTTWTGQRTIELGDDLVVRLARHCRCLEAVLEVRSCWWQEAERQARAAGKRRRARGERGREDEARQLGGAQDSEAHR